MWHVHAYDHIYRGACTNSCIHLRECISFLDLLWWRWRRGYTQDTLLHFPAMQTSLIVSHVWLSWPLNRWWCEQLYKMMFCFWIKLTDCQSQCVVWTSCVFEMSFTEAASSSSQGMNAAWQTDGQLSEISAAEKASAGFWDVVNKPKWGLSRLWAFLFKTKQVLKFKTTCFWLIDWKQQLWNRLSSSKRLTKAHTSVSQLATCGRLDQRFIKTPLKTFLLLMLHFKCFTCKPPRAVEATTGKRQVVFEQFCKHGVKMLHTRFWEVSSSYAASTEAWDHTGPFSCKSLSPSIKA